MAKLYGLQGAMTGRLGNTVMAVRNGEQIARKYQPVVLNPSTPAQVQSRAKLKLLSQLSAVVAPYIGIRKQGAVSSRNLFTKMNYPLTSYADNSANITLQNVQLTSSVVALPTISATRGETALTVGLAYGSPDFDVDRMVYVMLVSEQDNKLRIAGSAVATAPGTGNRWNVELPLLNDKVTVLAYGVRFNSEAARVRFGNMTAPAAVDIASLLVSSQLLESDVTPTETRGVVVPVA